MRIVHLIWQLQLGGAEAMLVDIVNAQSAKEDVTLVIGNALSEGSLIDLVTARVKVRLLNRPRRSRNPWHIFKLYRILRATRPDIIHAHQESFIRVLKFLDIPRVVTIHGTGLPMSKHTNKFDAIYCISDAVADDFRKRFPSLMTHTIRNGIDFSKIRPKTHIGDHRFFKIVQVGRLDHREKGQDILLHAVKLANDALGEPRVSVDFIGDGPSRSFLTRLAQELGVMESCRFLGARPRSYVYENLHRYDLLVQPSRLEGFGLTVAEAMASEIPVLVSDIDGPMEVIGHGQFGYFFRNEDANDCARQILSVLHQPVQPAIAEERKEAAAHVTSSFDVVTTANTYLLDYARVVAAKGPFSSQPDL